MSPAAETTPSRPTAVVAMPDAVEAVIFDDALRARLRDVARVAEEKPLHPLDGAEAEARLADAAVLLTGWGCPPLDAGVLGRAPALELVVHAAGTVKGLVTDALWERGVRVSSAAAANALPVAEFTLAAILLAGKRAFEIRERYREERRGTWAHAIPEIGNLDKRVGIVGASHIGRRVIQLLRPFDLEVWLTDPTLDADDAAALGARKCELPELLAGCQVVSLHAPSLPETRHMIGGDELARMPDGATLINTARGALVDHAALERELVSGRLHAVIDTTEPEVLPESSPLYTLPNVFLTPHIAGSIGGETRRMTALAIDEIERFAGGQALVHEVRRDDLGRIA